MVDAVTSIFGHFLSFFSGSALALGLALFSPLVAAVSLLVSFSNARRENALQSQDLVFQFDQALRDWGKDAIDAVVALEAAAYQGDEPDFTRQISRVSGAIDKGRMLLPNEPLTGKKDEPGVLHRPPVLEGLFAIYDHAAQIDAVNMGEDQAREVFVLRRAFIGELVGVLDTKQKRAVFQRLDARVRAQLSARSPSGTRHAERKKAPYSWGEPLPTNEQKPS